MDFRSLRAKMWSPLIICLVVGLATGEYAWKPGTEYKYQIKGRTLASLHQVSGRYVGVVSRATLTIQAKGSNAVVARISDAQYSPVHTSLPGGWASRVPEKELNYKTLPLSSKPFEIKFEHGVVKEMVVNRGISTPELNLIKSVVSQLQVDTQGTNEVKWQLSSQAPNLKAAKNVFRTMEDTITGECETMYDISPLPEWAIQSMPELAPMPSLRGDGLFYDIVKAKNYSNCDKRVAYHYGITGLTEWEPADNKMGHFLSRASVSRIVISGSLEKFTIQSSVTTNKIVLSPALYNAQNGMVASRMNVTLVSVKSSSSSPPSVADSRTVKDLVYDYNNPFSSEHGSSSGFGSSSKTSSARKSGKNNNSDSSDSDSSSSSENDSEDSESNSQESGSSTSESSEDQSRPIPKRFRRSASAKNKNASSGSSSSSSEDDSDDSESNGEGSSSSDSSSESENSSSSGSSSSESSSSDSNSSGSQGSGSSSSSSSSSSDEGSFSSGSSSSSSSSSSSEEHNPRPGMNKPPQIPLLPYFVGYQGNAVVSAKDLNQVSAVKKLCSQIASELQNPSSIPKKATLSKFVIVARLIRTMSSDDLHKVTSEIYSPIKSSGESSWAVFRDAVATAATGPCLTTVKEWIKSEKVTREEAAEVFASLASSSRTPTAEYLKNLFELATSQAVTKQPLFNTTAILSFATLARKAQVNNVTAHNYYPVHAFGRLSPINPKAVTEDYIPYMAKALRSAVRDGDSHKIQVFIRALGNLAHPKILSVFEPYLEGKEPMSTFQRTLMVASMNKLARTYPNVARRVLFNVYQNLGEAHEVRSAAVIVLMRTGPPAFMLQRMASFTNQDISQHVNSVVKSAIESAAALQGPHQHELKKNAEAAVHLLNPKPFGLHYSHSYLRSYVVKEMGLAYKQELSWIGSSDSLFPTSIFLSSRQNIGGMKSQNMALAVMASSWDDIMDVVSEQFDESSSSSSGRSSARSSGRSGGKGKSGSGSSSSSSSSHSAFSTEKIAEMLNIEPDSSEQAEGNILVRFMGTNRFFTFDNHTIESVPSLLKSAAAALRSGYKFNYNKLYNEFAMSLGFPTETGLPFVFSIKCPTYMALRGEIQAKTHPDMASGSHDSAITPDTVNATTALHFVYSKRMTTKISFVAPLTHHRYIAGVEKNFQINLPLKASFDLDAENTQAAVTLQPLYPSRDSMVFHYSTTPYTAKHDILGLNPVSQGNDFKTIHVREPWTMERTFGKDHTGFAFRVSYATEQKFMDAKWLFEKAQRHDALSLLLYPWAERTIHYNNINIHFDAQKSSSKSVAITADYSDDSSDSNHSGHSKEGRRGDSASSSSKTGSSMASPSTSKPISGKRQQEFLSRASSGIRDSSAYVLDFAVEFQGSKQINYVATAAYASSDVDEKSRSLFYFYRSPTYAASKQFEVCAATENNWPNVPLLNFAKALKANPDSSAHAELTFGENCGSGSPKISFKAKAQQTQDRKDYVRRSPLAQKCMSDMQAGNFLQYACQNSTAQANFLDLYTLDIQYDKIPSALKNFTYKAYSWARYYGFPHLDENAINATNKDGHVTVEANFEDDLKSANVSISAPNLDANFTNVRIHPFAKPILVQHPTWTATDRFLTKALQFQYTATCNLDENLVNTFDNRTYPAQLGKCWHVMMTSQPEEDDSSSSSSSSDPTDEVTILAREAGSNQKELKIILGDDVFDIKPSGSSKSGSSSESGDADGAVAHNGQTKPISHRSVNEAEDSDGETVATWYALPSGAVIFEAPEHDLVIMYNGNSARIQAGSAYRDDVVGLCGSYDSEPATDFTSPQNCILRDPKLFAASFAVPDQTCQGPAKEMQRRASSAPCFPVTSTPYEVIHEDDHNAGHQSSSSRKSSSQSKSSKNSGSSSSGCTEHRTKIVEEGSKICFTMRPLPACSDNCRATGKVEKTVPVHCISNSAAAQHFVQMVKKGANPDFSRKETTKTMKVNVPKSCAAH